MNRPRELLSDDALQPAALRRFLPNDQLQSFEPTLDTIRNNGSLPLEWPAYQAQSSQIGDGSITPATTRIPPLDQEAWNHLQVTYPGRPPPFQEKYRGTDDGYWRHPYPKGSWGPELGGSATVFSSDSGYGSKCSTTHSVISGSHNAETISSPCQLTPNDPSTLGLVSFCDNNRAQSVDMPFNVVGHTPVHSPYKDAKKCDFPGCPWTGKCQSDKRKHEARHKKQFKCDEPNCTRKEGFGTVNDLERHKKCVHHKVPDRGPKMKYMCFGDNCPRRHKLWPRLDNFRQHLNRIHPTENPEQLLKKSDEWYHSRIITPEIPPTIAAPSIGSPPRPGSPLEHIGQEKPDTSPAGAPQSAYAPTTPSLATMDMGDIFDPPDDLALSSIGISGRFESPVESDGPSQFDAQSSPTSKFHRKLVDLPTLNYLNMYAALGKESSETTMEELSTQFRLPTPGKHSDKVTEEAMYMLDALSRRLDIDRQNQPDPNDSERDKKRELLCKVVSAALEQLQGNVTQNDAVDTSDAGFFKCDMCSKKTRLKCELKKHQRRHEKPYGCTYPACHKKFGSKGDWKRHENSQHFYHQSWRCPLPDATDKNVCCAQLFYRQEKYVQHLKKSHNVQGDETKSHLRKDQIGRNGQYQFWCGFCKKIIPLTNSGLEAWNERFDHIDFDHFKQGQRIGDWLPAEGHLTKDECVQEQKRKAAMRKITGESEINGLDDSSLNENNSSRSSSISSTEGEKNSVISGQEDHRIVGESGQDSFVAINAQSHAESEVGPNSRKRKRDPADPFHSGAVAPHAKVGRTSSRVGLSEYRSRWAFRRAQHTGYLDSAVGEGQETAWRLFSARSAPRAPICVCCCQCGDGPFDYEVNIVCLDCSHEICYRCERQEANLD